MLELFLDALKETGIIAIYILVVCIFIEFIEQSTARSLKAHKILSGKAAPLIGAAVGLIPQCGFSAVSARLFSKGNLRIGTLLAVFIATSDEAIPIFIAHPDRILTLLPLLVLKFVFAVSVGFSLNAILKKYEASKLQKFERNAENSFQHLKVAKSADGKCCHNSENQVLNDNFLKHCDSCECHNESEQEHDIGCCGHHIACEHKKDNGFVVYFVHPLIHTLKIILFIFIVIFLFGTAIYYLGEDKLMSFMLSGNIFQPFLSSLVGLIPNCASSVVITELYLKGGLSFGSLFSGLSANAGIGFAILFRENKNVKESLFILIGLYLISSLFGMLLTALGNVVNLSWF